jgi:hypothetical protein
MLQLENLDARTRGYMRAEFEDDLDHESLYISPRLSERGVQDYPELLRAAIDTGSDVTFGNSLTFHGRMKETEERRVGAETKTVRAPATAADTLAEGEFNRMYMRGLCRRALDDAITALIVYRAKGVRQPRAESLALSGQPVDAAALLTELRARSESAPASDMLFGPNSGLSVKLPQVAA